jgi:hypothetical protein
MSESFIELVKRTCGSHVSLINLCLLCYCYSYHLHSAKSREDPGALTSWNPKSHFRLVVENFYLYFMLLLLIIRKRKKYVLHSWCVYMKFHKNPSAGSEFEKGVYRHTHTHAHTHTFLEAKVVYRGDEINCTNCLGMSLISRLCKILSSVPSCRWRLYISSNTSVNIYKTTWCYFLVDSNPWQSLYRELDAFKLKLQWISQDIFVKIIK